MNKCTADLLDAALQRQKAAAWARALNVAETTISNAKKRGRLSPTLAGMFAAELGEDESKWIATAGLETEPESDYRDKMLENIWRKR